MGMDIVPCFVEILSLNSPETKKKANNQYYIPVRIKLANCRTASILN